MITVPLSRFSLPAINALKNANYGYVNFKTGVFGFEFRPMYHFNISALGWATIDTLNSPKTCRLWDVETMSVVESVQLEPGIKAAEGWLAIPTPDPVPVDPARLYRLVCSVVSGDGDKFKGHLDEFITKAMANSTLIEYTQIVSGTAVDEYPSKTPERMFGAPTFFVGPFVEQDKLILPISTIFGPWNSAVTTVTPTLL